MKKILFLTGLLLSVLWGNAQKKDSAEIRRKAFESSIFFSGDTLTKNDYLLRIEKVLQLLSRASMIGEPEESVKNMEENLQDDDSVLSIIKERISANERALRVRNLEMYNILLDHIRENTDGYARRLQQYDSTLDAYKKKVAGVTKDSLLRNIFRDTSLRNEFQPQLAELRSKWQRADSILKKMNLLISNTQAHASNNLININELHENTTRLTETLFSRAFGKERGYLWKSSKISPKPRIHQRFRTNISRDKEITQYYFSHTKFQVNLLLVIGLIFFSWILINFRILKKKDKLSSLDRFHFRYINGMPVFATLIFILNLAPLLDLNAPAVYIEFIELLMLVVLTIYFSSRIPKKILYIWFGFIVLFLLSFLVYLRLPFSLSRWISLAQNTASFLLGLFAFLNIRKEYRSHKVLIAITILYFSFNFLAALCNIFGRVTLMQILTSTAIYTVIQTVSLVIFERAVREAILLQIQRSRVTKGYGPEFNLAPVEKGLSKTVIAGTVIIWLIVFTTNLNLYNWLYEKIRLLLSVPRTIGSFSFSLGGLLLFLVILGAANFLQKYIGYFFGDIGDEVSISDKAHRSRLLITRLLLLVSGFLLAVAASGLPIDKITVILGALGVGIGLGLQGIVNNFVSGIILIFDRTLRIGDTVQLGDKKGRVREISVRSSTLLTEDGAEVIIPNGDILSHNIVNWTLSNNNVRLDIGLTLDHLLLPDQVKEWLSEITGSMPEIFISRPPEIQITNLSSHSITLKVYLWCTDVSKTDDGRTMVLLALQKKLKEQGIRIL